MAKKPKEPKPVISREQRFSDFVQKKIEYFTENEDFVFFLRINGFYLILLSGLFGFVFGIVFGILAYK